MSFEKFINANYSKWQSKKDQTVIATPLDNDRPPTKVNLKKGDVVDVTEHTDTARDFKFKDKKYMMPLGEFSKAFVRVKK